MKPIDFCKILLFFSLFVLSVACSNQNNVTKPPGSDTIEPDSTGIGSTIDNPIDENPFISGFVELQNIQSVGDTIKTRLEDANIRVSDTTGLRLLNTETNSDGEFYIELDAFIPGKPYELFIHSPQERIYRNIQFIYTVEKNDEIEIVLNSDGGTKLNIDYLDLNTGKGRGKLISN